MSAKPAAVIPFPGPTTPNLVDLASTIRDQHRCATMAALSAVEHAIHCGRALIQAKAQVDHGQWLQWLSTNCPTISTRTAQAYMKLAAWCTDHPEIAMTSAELPLRDALRLVSDTGARDPNAQRDALLSPKALAALDALPEDKRPNKTLLGKLAGREKFLRRLRRDLKVMKDRPLCLLPKGLHAGLLNEAKLARDALDRLIEDLKERGK